jgi:hypothetical protein
VASAVMAMPDSASRLARARQNLGSMIFRKHSRKHITVMCGLTQRGRGFESGARAQHQHRDARLTNAPQV